MAANRRSKKPRITLRILGHDVHIEIVAKSFSDERIGQADTETGEIRIAQGMEKSIAEATILHEIVHFIDVQLDLGLKEEQVVGVAQGIFQVLADNPNFLKR